MSLTIGRKDLETRTRVVGRRRQSSFPPTFTLKTLRSTSDEDILGTPPILLSVPDVQSTPAHPLIPTRAGMMQPCYHPITIPRRVRASHRASPPRLLEMDRKVGGRHTSTHPYRPDLHIHAPQQLDLGTISSNLISHNPDPTKFQIPTLVSEGATPVTVASLRLRTLKAGQIEA
ncbi:hypothetical protein D9613_007465 [Agrocybe pediades]|uniref:Uncharacterized protein n=1 Tax=Agrocybe pediades TaxID=84607 RepID=A0A8H4VMM1_9AGAR|nr:hypothetical protein D9613_007465 [Agrocybe pediades]